MDDSDVLSVGKDLMSTNFRALLVFAVVLEMGSLSRAASVLGCTSSSVSVLLKQVRGGADQMLFLREGRELVPTPAAQKLGLELSGCFGQLGKVLLRQGLRCERRSR